jgi:chorismate mutase
MATNQEETSNVEAASTEEEAVIKTDLTLAETIRLLQPATNFIAQEGWDQVPRMLAIAMAIHQVVNEQAPRVRQLAIAHLRIAEPKKVPPD